MGRSRCTVHWEGFRHLCASCHELLLRWVCHSDRFPRPWSDAGLRGPLFASGSEIKDLGGKRVRLHGVNWPGMHITHVPSGLDRTPLRSLIQRVRGLGFNVVRLTWDVHTALANPVVEKRLVAANPKLVGLRALEVMVKVFEACEEQGLAIWLAPWSCEGRCLESRGGRNFWPYDLFKVAHLRGQPYARHRLVLQR